MCTVRVIELTYCTDFCIVHMGSGPWVLILDLISTDWVLFSQALKFWQQDLLQKALKSWCCMKIFAWSNHGKHSTFRYVSSLHQLSQGMVTEYFGLSGLSYWHTQEERPSSGMWVEEKKPSHIATTMLYYPIIKYLCVCVCMSACIYRHYIRVCVCVYMYICLYVYMYVCITNTSMFQCKQCKREQTRQNRGIGVQVMQKYTVVLRIQISFHLSNGTHTRRK